MAKSKMVSGVADTEPSTPLTFNLHGCTIVLIGFTHLPLVAQTCALALHVKTYAVGLLNNWEEASLMT